MATLALQDFVEARLRAYDPLIDLTPGSPAEEQVVIPIVNRFQPDPLEMSIQDFIAARLAQEIPDLNIDEGTGVMDFLVKPDQLLMDPVIREVQLIKQGQSLANPELLADSEADALVANFFITRNLGGLATGRVRLYFNAPVAINITIGNVCYTADGHRYLPTTLQSISAESMLFNSSGNLYYFDINVTAEAGGDDYNVTAGSIVGVTNLSVAVRATNISAFTNGLLSEDTASLVARAQQSITERSLVVPRGTIARLQDQFADMTQIQVIGTGDPEMQRDLVTGGDLGPVLLQGSDGFAIDDGKGGTTTTRFSTAFGDFTTALPIGKAATAWLQINMMAQGNDGAVAAFHLDQFYSASAVFTAADVGSVLVLVKAANGANMGTFLITGLGHDIAGSVTLENKSFVPWAGVIETGIAWVLVRGQKEYPITEILSSTALMVDGDIPLTPFPMSWAIRKKELTISNIPGGVLFGEAANTMQSDEVHVGGCTDFYVRGANTTSLSQNFLNIVDETPFVSSETGNTVLATFPGVSCFLFDPNVDFVSTGVRPGMYLIVKASHEGNEGVYQIVSVGVDPTGHTGVTWSNNFIQVDSIVPFPGLATDYVSYVIQAAIDIDLISPKNIRGTGAGGITGQLSNVFTTATDIDFDSMGVSVGDTLRILSGADAGDYQITVVSGVGNRDLTLSRQTLHLANGVSWEIFLPSTGITLPLVRVSEVTLLDGSHNPTAVTIPYADPVDARSTTFVNTGRGIKLSVTDVTIGIVGRVDLSAPFAPLPVTTLGFFVNDTLYVVALTGLTTVSQVVNAINAVVPDLARTITPEGSTAVYLSLGSRNRYVYIVSTIPELGLMNQDDSRQITAAADIVWNDPDYDLRAESDVVTITVGADVGSFYLVSVVSASKILVVGFDETAKDVRFLTPCVGASLTIGSRSIGTARVYFLEPTSFEVHGSYRPALNNSLINLANKKALSSNDPSIVWEDPFTYFTLESTGQRFLPDPSLSHTAVPLAGQSPPNNLTIGTGGIVTSEQNPVGVFGHVGRSPSVNFLSNRVAIGDYVDITYQPIQGTVDISASAPSVNTQILVLKIDGGVYTINFSGVISPSDIADQINAVVTGVANIAAADTIVSAVYIRLEADVRITVMPGSTAAATLGMVGADNKSYAADNGPYRVVALYDTTDHTTFQNYPNKIQIVDKNFSSPPAPGIGQSNQAHHFIVRRAGVQRLHSTGMSNNLEYGLYYMDVELVSEGSGDVWNIPEGQVLVVAGYKSDGYTLITADPNLSYSIKEQVKMRVSNTILAVGQSDDPTAVTNLTNVSVAVAYDQSPLVSSIQSFASADLDRVLTASILVRHLQPAYVNFDLNYSGGSATNVILSDIDAYLAALSPNDSVSSSSVQALAKNRGATFVTNPITLLAVTHIEDRTIVVERSTNYVTHGKLSTFFSGVITPSQS